MMSNFVKQDDPAFLAFLEDAKKKEAAIDSFHAARIGNITGSGVGEIMGTPTAKSTYLYGKIAERMTGKPSPNFESQAMREGKEKEAECCELIKSIGFDLRFHTKDQITITVGEKFVVTPDGFIFFGDGTKQSTETKCPTAPTHAKYLTEIKDFESLKKVNKNYYWQVVSQMVSVFSHFYEMEFEEAIEKAKGSKGWFISYHPDFVKDKDRRLHCVEIAPPDKDFDELYTAVIGAVQEINEKIGYENK